jgi:hypothetical protein
MISSSTHRIAVVLAALVALVAVTSIAQAGNSKPAGMTRAEYRALILRSEGLNQKYHLGQWKNVPQGMTSAEYAALMARSEGLNKVYGVGQRTGPIVSEKTAGLIQPEPAQTVVASTDGFDWSDAGIGAAGAFGLVLLAGGLVAGSRHTRQSTRVRTS